MFKKYFLYTGLLFLGLNTSSYAQSNIQTLSSPAIFSTEASFLNPALINNPQRFTLNVAPMMGGDLYIGNNMISAGDVISIAKDINDNGISNFAPFHTLRNSLKPKNTMMMHADMTILNAGLRIGSQENGLNIGFSIRQHMYANLTFNDDLFRLLLGGNKQFAGKTAVFNPEISFLGYTDFGVSAAKSFSVGDFTITPAARVRYLLGNAAINTKGTKMEFYTDPNGEHIKIDNNISARFGGMIGFEEDKGLLDFDFSKGLSSGFAFDLGATVKYDNITAGLAIVDNGFISFRDKASWIVSAQNTIFWEGFDLMKDYEGDEDFAKDIFGSFDLDTTRKGFNTSIGSKIVLHGNYGLIAKEDKKENTYYAHNFGLNYIQGFSNMYNSSTSPRYAIYYQYNYKNMFSTGLSYNGFGNIHDVGFNIGAKLVGINFGIGSSSLISLISTQSSRQFNLFGTIGLSF